MIRSAFTVLQGTALAQLLGVLMLPVIGRLFSPDAFGDFQLFQSALTLALPFAAFRLEYAILRVRRDGTVGYVLALCLAINVAMALLLSVLLRVGSPFLPEVHREALWATDLLPLALLVAGALQTASYLPVRAKRFRLIAGSKLTQAVTFHGGAIALGAGGWPTAVALVASDLAGRAAAAALLLVRWLTSEPRVGLRRVRRTFAAILRRYRDDPLYAVPSSFVSALAAALPVFALSTLFSQATAGQFAMAWRISLMPVAMVTFAISQVVNSEVSELIRERRRGAFALTSRVAGGMAVLAVPPIVLAAVAGEAIVPFVVGRQWTDAGRMVQAMTPFLFMSVVAGPLNTLLVVLGRQWVHLAWEGARAVLLIAGFLLAERGALSPLETVLLYSAAMAVMSAVYLVLVRFVVRDAEAGFEPVQPPRTPVP